MRIGALANLSSEGLFSLGRGPGGLLSMEVERQRVNGRPFARVIRRFLKARVSPETETSKGRRKKKRHGCCRISGTTAGSEGGIEETFV